MFRKLIFLPLPTLLALALANTTFHIGYTEETGNKITWRDGQDICANKFQTLVGGPHQEHASPCSRLFTVDAKDGKKIDMAYQKCDKGWPEVWEVDGNGAMVKQWGSCTEVKDKKEDCWFGNIFDTSDGHDVVFEWSCEIAV